jgi:hypothetical protein
VRDKKSRYKIRYFLKIKGSHAENFSQIGATFAARPERVMEMLSVQIPVEYLSEESAEDLC